MFMKVDELIDKLRDKGVPDLVAIDFALSLCSYEEIELRVDSKVITDMLSEGIHNLEDLLLEDWD